MDLDQLLKQWELWEQQLAEVDTKKVEIRFEQNEVAPGVEARHSTSMDGTTWHGTSPAISSSNSNAAASKATCRVSITNWPWCGTG